MANKINLSRIGLGTWAIGGGGWKFAWGPQDNKESIRTIIKALECGINWIDTAPLYGFGHAETIIGKALRETSFKPYISTKCGLSWNSKRHVVHNLTKENICKELDASLRRLKRDYIDIYHIHWPSPEKDIHDAWLFIDELVKQGKIRYGAVSNFSKTQIAALSEISPPAFVQNEFNLFKKESARETLQYCTGNGIRFLAYGVLGKGILSGKYNASTIASLPADDHRKRDKNFQDDILKNNCTFAEKIKEIAHDISATPSQLSIAMALYEHDIYSVICGMRNENQVTENIKALDIVITEDIVNKIKACENDRLLSLNHDMQA